MVFLIERSELWIHSPLLSPSTIELRLCTSERSRREFLISHRYDFASSTPRVPLESSKHISRPVPYRLNTFVFACNKLANCLTVIEGFAPSLVSCDICSIIKTFRLESCRDYIKLLWKSQALLAKMCCRIYNSHTANTSTMTTNFGSFQGLFGSNTIPHLFPEYVI